MQILDAATRVKEVTPLVPIVVALVASVRRLLPRLDGPYVMIAIALTAWALVFCVGSAATLLDVTKTGVFLALQTFGVMFALDRHADRTAAGAPQDVPLPPSPAPETESPPARP